MGLKRIDAAQPRYRNLPILGVRNRARFSVRGSRLRYQILCKLYGLAVALFWNEQRYRAGLLAEAGAEAVPRSDRLASASEQTR
ncbi:MAG TPA: hypothetical protein VM782_18660 [Stellaceae bacterium]|nr:hypothetical protein [Stellaceae bacterium]